MRRHSSSESCIVVKHRGLAVLLVLVFCIFLSSLINYIREKCGAEFSQPQPSAQEPCFRYRRGLVTWVWK